MQMSVLLVRKGADPQIKDRQGALRNATDFTVVLA